jgi:hypothetical protein
MRESECEDEMEKKQVPLQVQLRHAPYGRTVWLLREECLRNSVSSVNNECRKANIILL